jgi:hypothetical protein
MVRGMKPRCVIPCHPARADDAGRGVVADTGSERPDLRPIAHHFVKTLDPLRPTWRNLVLRRAPRRSVWMEQRRRQHELTVGLSSGIVGAAVGAAATIAVAFLA